MFVKLYGTFPSIKTGSDCKHHQASSFLHLQSRKDFHTLFLNLFEVNRSASRTSDFFHFVHQKEVNQLLLVSSDFRRRKWIFSVWRRRSELIKNFLSSAALTFLTTKCVKLSCCRSGRLFSGRFKLLCVQLLKPNSLICLQPVSRSFYRNGPTTALKIISRDEKLKH